MLKNKALYFAASVLIILALIGTIIFREDTKLLKIKPICDRCNVILISLDTLGSNHLPCYGYDRNTAPNLCGFAKDNILFTNSFSNASWTRPSHFSIFTSLYPNHHGMVSNDASSGKLSQNIITMAEYFKKANYNTIYVGPLKDQSLPLDQGIGRGFDTFLEEKTNWSFDKWKEAIERLISENKQSSFLFLHTYWVHYPYFVDRVSGGNNRIFTNDYYSDIPLDSDVDIRMIDFPLVSDFTPDFINFLKIERGDGVANKLRGVNNPVEAKQIYEEIFSNKGTSEPDISDYYFYKMSKTKERVDYGKALYDEMIFYLDKQLSMIFDLVSNSQVSKNTIIIITSDHGEAFLEHGSMSHPADQLYNTITSVPLIMYIPGIKQKKVDALVQGVDILPTVLKLTGIKYKNNIVDGIDLTGLVVGSPFAKENDYLISEGPNVDTIRNDQWKLYRNVNDVNGKTSYELYNLKNDPFETINLYKQDPFVVNKLEENLNRIIYKNE